MQLSDALAALRLKYKKRGEVFLEEQIAVKEPIALFRRWLDEALANTDIIEPNGMCLSTVGKYALMDNTNLSVGIQAILCVRLQVRCSVVANGSAQRCDHRGIHLFHQLRQSQGE